MERFLEYLITHYMSDNTINTYYRTAKYFLQSYNKKDINKITKNDIKNYYLHLENKGLKGKSISVYFEGLRSYIKYLYYFEDIITPITKIRNGKAYADDIPRMKFEPKLNNTLELSTHEVNRLKLKIEEEKDWRTLLIVELMSSTGLRIHEVLGIRTRQILEKEIEVKGKGGKYRHIYPTGRVRTLARNHIKENKVNTEFLFKGNLDKTLAKCTVNRILKIYAKKCKVDKEKVFPHNFRHFFTIQEIKRGTPLNELALKLGINDIKVLSIYQSRNLTK